MLDGRRNSFEIAHRPLAGIKIENLAQRDVERADAAANRSGERPLDGHTKIADGFDGVAGQPFFVCVESFFAGENFVPGNLAFAAVSMLNGSVEHPARGFPDVASRAVPFDERDDRVTRDLQFAAAVVYGRPVVRNCLAVVSALHVVPDSLEGFE